MFAGTLGLPPPSGMTDAVVGISRLAVDSSDRPVLLGEATTGSAYCGYSGYDQTLSRTFLARLTEAGTPDPDFGDHGVVIDDSHERTAGLAMSPRGGIAYASPTGAPCPRLAEGLPAESESSVETARDSTRSRPMYPRPPSPGRRSAGSPSTRRTASSYSKSK